MGFMDKLRQQYQTQQTPDLLQQAKQIVGDDPHVVLAKMQDNGTMINLPNGKTLSVKEAVSMAEGKTAAQFLAELMR